MKQKKEISYSPRLGGAVDPCVNVSSFDEEKRQKETRTTKRERERRQTNKHKLIFTSSLRKAATP